MLRERSPKKPEVRSQKSEFRRRAIREWGLTVLFSLGYALVIVAVIVLVKARQKSRALREVVAGNEKLKEWLRSQGDTKQLDAFYDFQNAQQKGKTEEIVAAERARLKPAVPNMPSNVKPPATESGGD